MISSVVQLARNAKLRRQRHIEQSHFVASRKWEKCWPPL